jgi:hypothetical protein
MFAIGLNCKILSCCHVTNMGVSTTEMNSNMCAKQTIQQPISKDKNVMARARKYYSKNNYLTLRSKIKVPRRSLRYTTHHLMVMHSHTKYHWLSKNVMAQTRKYYLKNIIWPSFLSFEIGQWYLVCGCMTIRWCVAYHNDLCGTLTFDLICTDVRKDKKSYGPDKKWKQKWMKKSD